MILDNPVDKFFFKNTFIILLFIISIYEEIGRVHLCVVWFYIVTKLVSEVIYC